MRIGTWNVANRAFTEEHKNLLLEQDCDVRLLTEVNPKWSEGDGTKVLHFNLCPSYDRNCELHNKVDRLNAG